jgi:hypothetical protein
MNRTALIAAAVIVLGALLTVTTRPGTTTPATVAGTSVDAPTEVPAKAPRILRTDVGAQHDQVTAEERSRIGRTRLLDVTLVTAAQAHGVSITTGIGRRSDRDPQDMVVTPAPDLTVREIAAAISRICDALEDPCVRRDYRFLIQTPTGRAVVPARLIHPKDRPMPARPAATTTRRGLR